eukprot:TRINITY_DN24691_c0_g2_i2.p2 TRINITY_DN24691_c0_g2~~TRINITY_DN24691_c0_g2_i2.p2  ORF type:complete len:121 (-),score=26.48 TRINITY_DN24691_c0_g2_i2:139-501(-)
MQRGLVGSEMCIRDRYQRRVHGGSESRENNVKHFYRLDTCDEESGWTKILTIDNQMIHLQCIFQVRPDRLAILLLEKSTIKKSFSVLMKVDVIPGKKFDAKTTHTFNQVIKDLKLSLIHI